MFPALDMKRATRLCLSLSQCSKQHSGLLVIWDFGIHTQVVIMIYFTTKNKIIISSKLDLQVFIDFPKS